MVLRKQGGRRVAGCGAEGKASTGVKIEGFGRYRGSLVARATGGNILVINELGSEAYVKGVVPNEVPASWPAAALEAQAVVARSYGLATERDGPFDHYADTRSQVYGGKGSETRETNRAVEQTARKIVTYRGDPAITYYFSTSGGQTENSEFGFAGGNAVPVPEIGRRSLRRRVAGPQLDGEPLRRRRWSRSSTGSSTAGSSGSRS